MCGAMDSTAVVAVVFGGVVVEGARALEAEESWHTCNSFQLSIRFPRERVHPHLKTATRQPDPMRLSIRELIGPKA